MEKSRAAEEVVDWAVDRYGQELAVCTSFQKAGMVILDMAIRRNPKTRVFTLDTGRLPDETYDMIELVRDRYHIQVETVSPETSELEQMVTRHGPNLFKRDVASRMLCCKIRKVRPMGRKLRGFQAYMVGLRRGQSPLRAALPQVDYSGGLVKVSPLIEWSLADVDTYLDDHHIPVHPLYGNGYTSIGCGPCTRAIQEGEGERAGRWWWEDGIEKECGIHLSPDGRAERTVDVMLRDVLAGAGQDMEEDIDLGFDPGI